MNSDSELTILLLLKDNAPFTWRWMRYANQTKFPFPVLIADGGSDDQVAMGLKDKSLFPNVNYEYVRYPHDKTLVEYRAKLVDAFSRIKTPFVVRASNDDFYTTEGLRAGMEFLRTHPDYSVSRGEIYSFRINSKDHIYGPIQTLGLLYHYPANQKATALERVRKHFEFMHGLWHDVSRTKDMQEIYQEMEQVQLTEEVLEEHLVDSLIITRGKVHRGQGTYMLHQVNPYGEGVKYANKYRNPFNWVMSDSWPINFDKFLITLSKAVARVERLEMKKTYYRIQQTYLTYVFGQRMIGGYINKQMERQLSVKKLLVERIRKKLFGLIHRRNQETDLFPKEVIEPFREFLKTDKVAYEAGTIPSS